MSVILPNKITNGPLLGSTNNGVARWGGINGNILLDSPQVIVGSTNNELKITCAANNSSALELKAAASQTGHILNVTDNSDVSLVRITSGGKLQADIGLRATANDWGDSLSGWSYGDFVAEHTIIDNNGNFDTTGNANGEKLFYDTINSPFTQADVDNKNWIVINSGVFKGAKAEIIEYIDADNVLIHAHGACWDEDLSGVNYKIYKAPQFIVSSCYDTHIHVNGDGQVHIESSGGTYTGHAQLCIGSNIGADGSDAFHIHHNANGYNDSDAIQIFYKTGDLQTGDRNQIIDLNIDESLATAGHIDGIYINTTTVSGITREGIHVGSGFTNAITVSGASVDNPGYGYEVTGGTVVDRVNSGGVGDNAFTNIAVNQALFDNDNDYILIGSDNKFEVVESIFLIPSSKNLLFDFYYSKAGGNWTQFYPIDGTQGGTKSGAITFPAPGDWTKDDEAEIDADITNAYYLKIARTYSFVVPTLPVEYYFKTIIEQAGDTGMKIKGDGSIKLPYLTTAPASLENGLLWMENDGLHLYYNSAEKVVAGV